MNPNKSVSVILTDVDERNTSDMPKLRVSIVDGIIFFAVVKESETNSSWTYETLAEVGVDYSVFTKAIELMENEDNLQSSFPIDFSFLDPDRRDTILRDALSSIKTS